MSNNHTSSDVSNLLNILLQHILFTLLIYCNRFFHFTRRYTWREGSLTSLFTLLIGYSIFTLPLYNSVRIASGWMTWDDVILPLSPSPFSELPSWGRERGEESAWEGVESPLSQQNNPLDVNSLFSDSQACFFYPLRFFKPNFLLLCSSFRAKMTLFQLQDRNKRCFG